MCRIIRNYDNFFVDQAPENLFGCKCRRYFMVLEFLLKNFGRSTNQNEIVHATNLRYDQVRVIIYIMYWDIHIIDGYCGLSGIYEPFSIDERAFDSALKLLKEYKAKISNANPDLAFPEENLIQKDRIYIKEGTKYCPKCNKKIENVAPVIEQSMRNFILEGMFVIGFLLAVVANNKYISFAGIIMLIISFSLPSKLTKNNVNEIYECKKCSLIIETT